MHKFLHIHKYVYIYIYIFHVYLTVFIAERPMNFCHALSNLTYLLQLVDDGILPTKCAFQVLAGMEIT